MPSTACARSTPFRDPLVAPNNDPNRAAVNKQCVSEANAAASEDFNAAKTMPKARTIVGGGVIGVTVGVVTKSNPWGWAATAITAFRDNIGGAIVGSVKYGLTYSGCMAQSGAPLSAPASF
jgi:hypothetical protein